jgi:hypothetical protein
MPKREVIAQAVAQAGKVKVRVALVRRPGRKNLWLTWLDPKLRDGKGDYAFRDLGHDDEAQGEDECRQLAALLLSARGGVHRETVPPAASAAVLPNSPPVTASATSTHIGEYPGQSLTLVELFAMYEAARIDPPGPGLPPRKSHKQRNSDLHRMELWQEFATSACPVLSIDPDKVEDYTAWRRRQGIADTTIGHEVGFLKGVFNWATKKRGPTGLPLMLFNPIGDRKRIRSVEPNAPVADDEWFLRTYRVADRADPRGLLRCMMMLCREHGWRLAAWCHLWASDIDLSRSDLFPYGRVRKRSANEKATKLAARKGKVGKKTKWVPLTPRSRNAAMRLLRRTKVVGNMYVFLAPSGRGPWQGQYALHLLHTAELLVGHPERLRFLRQSAKQVGDRVTIRKGRGIFTLEHYLARHGNLLTRDVHHTARLVAKVNEAMGWDWSASLEPERGRGYHSLRRKWGNDRKHEPLVDVAYAGDWHPGTLLNHYQREDPRTTLRVMLAGERMRDLGPFSDQDPSSESRPRLLKP